MKKIIFFVFSFLFLGFFHVNALDSYVYDNAKILGNDTENYIESYSEFMHDTEKIDYVVCTIQSSDDLPLEEYIDSVYSELDISEKGLLILVSKDNRSLQVKTGTLLGETISEKVINEYIEEFFLPSLSNNDWDEGIKNGYSAFYKLLCNYYNIDSSAMTVYDSDSFLIKYKNVVLIFLVFLCIFLGHILCLYFDKVLARKRKRIFLDELILIGSICLNIGIFIFTFHFMEDLVWILMGFELVIIFSECQSVKKKVKNRTRKRSKKSKKSLK